MRYGKISELGDLEVTGTFYASGAMTASAGGYFSGGTYSFAGDVVELTGSLLVSGVAVFDGGISGSLQALADGLPYLIAGPNIAIATNSLGQVEVTGSGGGESYFISTLPGSIYTSGSAAFVGAGDEWTSVLTPQAKGLDVFFYVSGSQMSKNLLSPGVALFGGDVVVSGTITQGLGSNALGPYSVAFGSGTVASGTSQTVVGTFNVQGNTTSLFVVGNGAGEDVGGGEGGFNQRYDVLRVNPGADPANGGAVEITGTLAQGSNNLAIGSYSHAQGESTAIGYYSHAEGESTAGANFFYVDCIQDGLGNYVFRKSGFDISSEFPSSQLIVKDDPGNNLSYPNFYYVDTTVTVSFDGHSTYITSSSEPPGFGLSGMHYLVVDTNYLSSQMADSVKGQSCHAEGATLANGDDSHSEGGGSIAAGDTSHAEGFATLSAGSVSHSEGNQTQALGDYSHAEGLQTVASNFASHAEGNQTTAYGYGSHAEGYYAVASGTYSHAEGHATVASGDNSHAEGYVTFAIGPQSHAAGIYTIASGDGQSAIGKYNQRNNDFSIFVVGDGTGDDDSLRHDVFRVNTAAVEVTGSLSVMDDVAGPWMTVGAPSPVGSDVFFFVSGSVNSGDRAVFGGDLVVSGSVLLVSASTTSSIAPGPACAPMGTARLPGGAPNTVTVYNSLARTDSLIFLTKQEDGDPNHAPMVTAKNNGNFTISSGGNSDTDLVAYLIVNPAGSLP